MFWGFVILIVGIILLLQSFGIATDVAWKYIWPILIIILGLSILFKPWRRKFFGWGKGHSRQNDEKKEENQ